MDLQSCHALFLQLLIRYCHAVMPYMIIWRTWTEIFKTLYLFSRCARGHHSELCAEWATGGWGRALPHLGDYIKWFGVPPKHSIFSVILHSRWKAKSGDLTVTRSESLDGPGGRMLQVGYVQYGSVSKLGTSKYVCYCPKQNSFHGALGVPKFWDANETNCKKQTLQELIWLVHRGRMLGYSSSEETQPTALQPSIGDPWINQWSCIFFDLYFIFLLFFTGTVEDLVETCVGCVVTSGWNRWRTRFKFQIRQHFEHFWYFLWGAIALFLLLLQA